MTRLTNAISIVFSSRPYIVLGVGSFVVFFTLYAFVLPATYTGGRIGLVSLQFLNLKLGVFAFLFATALAFIVPFSVYSVRNRVSNGVYAFRKQESQKTSATALGRTKSASGQTRAAGSVFGSILPPLLCCSPFLPSIAALAGGLSPFAFRVSGFLQGFIATYETQIYIIISAILVYSIHLNAKQVNKACVSC